MSVASLTKQTCAGIGVLTDVGARSAGILVAFTDRHGGVSGPPYDSLNLGALSGDDRLSLSENRRRAALAIGFRAHALALARQVHGAEIIEVSSGQSGVLGDADGLVSHAVGPVLGILTADCAAVIVAGERGLGILHAGWRGLAAGVIARGVDAVGPIRQAWIGPCIRACCYEVGPDVVSAFDEAGLPVAPGRRVDISRAAVAALERAGISDIAASDDCTGCSPSYFSYRRDGRTGRQGAFAALVEPSR